MSTIAVKIFISDGMGVIHPVSDNDPNVVRRIESKNGFRFIFVDDNTGYAPYNITARRIGNDLHVSVKGSEEDQTQWIIERYFSSGAELIGLGEDGEYHSYVNSDENDDGSISEESVGSALVLGAESLGNSGFATANSAGLGLGGWSWPDWRD